MKRNLIEASIVKVAELRARRKPSDDLSESVRR